MTRGFATARLAVFLLVTPAAADTESYLERIRDEPLALNRFMEELPKGGDIHSHLSGAVYAESMIGWGAEDGVCVSETTYVANGPPCAVGDRPLSDALSDGDFYNDILAAWSMRGFVPGEESGHDHF